MSELIKNLVQIEHEMKNYKIYVIKEGIEQYTKENEYSYLLDVIYDNLSSLNENENYKC